MISIRKLETLFAGLRFRKLNKFKNQFLKGSTEPGNLLYVGSRIKQNKKQHPCDQWTNVRQAPTECKLSGDLLKHREPLVDSTGAQICPI